MSGIYIHIPFCKKKCIYCNFHISTNISNIYDMISCIKHEIIYQKNFLKDTVIDTIYFGGGTPSIIKENEIYEILNTIYYNYNISNIVEITLECNPDDISKKKLNQFYKLGINRLSIGVQSFNDKDLIFMNRSHNREDAYRCIIDAKNIGFNNINVDLIYGIPNMDNKTWIKNIQFILDLEINHLSAYALTVEPKTNLYFLIKKNKIKNIDEYNYVQHYNILVKKMKEKNFIHYEISNFGKNGFLSKHNINYWKCSVPYLGIGPSAHSFNGKIRQWNIKNNILYIKAIKNKMISYKNEILSITDMYNEYILTGLRTIWGINTFTIKKKFGKKYYNYLINNSKYLLEKKVIYIKNKNMIVNQKYWIVINSIISKLFFI